MGLKVGEDDPAFLLVELNRLALEEAISIVVERLAPLPSTIEQAGIVLAKGVANAAACVIDEEFAAARDKISKEADTARAAAARAISELAQAQRRAHTDKWRALGFLFGSVLLVCGLAAGYAFALAINTSPKPTTSDVRPAPQVREPGLAAISPRRQTSADRINTVDMPGAESSLAAKPRYGPPSNFRHAPSARVRRSSSSRG
jgi:hypothetical protein